jgi:hypothetical protein
MGFMILRITMREIDGEIDNRPIESIEGEFVFSRTLINENNYFLPFYFILSCLQTTSFHGSHSS